MSGLKGKRQTKIGKEGGRLRERVKLTGDTKSPAQERGRGDGPTDRQTGRSGRSPET